MVDTKLFIPVDSASRPRRLSGLRVAVTSWRRGAALEAHLVRAGATVLWAPTLQQRDEPAGTIIEQTAPLLSGEVGCVAVATGDALSRWLRVLQGPLRRRVADALDTVPVVVRGRKAATELGFDAIPVTAATTGGRNADLAALAAATVAAPATVLAVVGGAGSDGLVGTLRALGYRVFVVRPSRIGPPDDTGPIVGLVEAATTGLLDVVCFTNPMAVRGLVDFAAAEGARPTLLGVLGESVAAVAIGPATAEALASAGVRTPLVAPLPRTGSLVDLLETCLPDGARDLGDSGVQILAARRSIRVGSEDLRLSPLEFSLAVALRRRAGSVCPTDRLLAEIWPGGGDRRRLEVLVSRLRRRLDGTGVTVEAVRKRGYRFAGPANL